MPFEFISPGERKQVECRCTICKYMCKQSPCFPTPVDTKALIDAGHRDNLKVTYWMNIFTGKPYTLVAPVHTDNGCIFQDGHGLCRLHLSGLKPTEGKLSMHHLPDNGLREWICKKWEGKAGEIIIERFFPE